MKIVRLDPEPPKPEFRMILTYDDAMAVAAALNYFADCHKDADNREDWYEWAYHLRSLMR